MLVLDMDGTLLNEEMRISSRNKEAVKKAVHKGIKVVLATGRSFEGVIPFLEELELLEEGNYTVACCGALALNNKSRDIIHKYPIAHEDLKMMFRFCEEHDLDMSAYTTKDILTHHDNLFSKYDAIANNTVLGSIDFHQLDPELEVFKVNLINEGNEIRDEIINFFPTIKPESTLIRDKQSFNPNLLSELWRFPKEITEKYLIVQPLPFCVEILDKECNKALGVEAIQKIYGFQREEIICIGDSDNDIHMIEYAGLGVAMGNAIPAVKKIANEETKTNQEDGVAWIVEKYFL